MSSHLPQIHELIITLNSSLYFLKQSNSSKYKNLNWKPHPSEAEVLMLSRIATRQAWRTATKSTRISTSSPFVQIQSLYRPQVPSSRLLSTSVIRFAHTPMAAETDTQAEELQNTTGITPDSLIQTLKKDPTLSASHVDVQDISGGCGASFAALIVSDAFQGKSALQRHRLVNGILKEEIKAVHAWTPKCLTGEQWEKEKGKSL